VIDGAAALTDITDGCGGGRRGEGSPMPEYFSKAQGRFLSSSTEE